MKIWDTAGQERYQALIAAYLREPSMIFVIYDISNRKTFENIVSWHKMIIDYITKETLLVLCGNKTDLKRQVSSNEGQDLAKKLNMTFFETSCKTAENFDFMMYSVIAELPFFKQFEIDKKTLIKELQNVNAKNTNKIEVKEKKKDLIITDEKNKTENTKEETPKKKNNCPC